MPKQIPCRDDKLNQFWCYSPEASEVFLAGVGK